MKLHINITVTAILNRIFPRNPSPQKSKKPQAKRSPLKSKGPVFASVTIAAGISLSVISVDWNGDHHKHKSDGAPEHSAAIFALKRWNDQVEESNQTGDESKNTE